MKMNPYSTSGTSQRCCVVFIYKVSFNDWHVVFNRFCAIKHWVDNNNGHYVPLYIAAAPRWTNANYMMWLGIVWLESKGRLLCIFAHIYLFLNMFEEELRVWYLGVIKALSLHKCFGDRTDWSSWLITRYMMTSCGQECI